MAFTAIRVSAVLLLAVLAAPSVPVAAQSPNKGDTQDFKMFLHSIAVRRNARVCERSVPEYGRAFGDLYGKWSEQHRGELARGESLFTEALKDPKGYPFADRATLSKVEEGLAELAKPSKVTSPAKPTAQTTVACEKLLTFLKND